MRNLIGRWRAWGLVVVCVYRRAVTPEVLPEFARPEVPQVVNLNFFGPLTDDQRRQVAAAIGQEPQVTYRAWEEGENAR